jgi:hypothetical protein
MVNKLVKFLSIVALALPLCGAWPNSGIKYPAVAAPYVGPGDLVAGATGWWGLRAFTAALAGAGPTTTPVIDVLGSNTVTGCTIYLLGNATGALDLTTAGAGGVGNQCSLGATTFCTVTNTSCSISKIYDQTGNGNHLIQATAAKQPTLTFSCTGALPCLTFVSANLQALGITGSYSTGAVAQPNSMSAVAARTSNFTTQQNIVISWSGSLSPAEQLAYNGTSNQALIYAGSNVTATASNTTLHSFQANFSNTTSAIYVDGVSTSGTAGTQTSGVSAAIGSNNNTAAQQYMDGHIMEAGIWTGVGFSSTQATNLCHNQFTYYGTATSC